MAIVYPDFTTISKLRTPATEGELHILSYLSDKLDESFEIFFNPFLDGDRPDIIILKKGSGAVIVEVKDWDLALYSVGADNKWSVTTPDKKRQPIRSPQQQAYHYKQNMFDLHLPILGLADARNGNFWKVIHPFVYFHNSSDSRIKALYAPALAELSALIDDVKMAKRQEKISGEAFNKRSEHLKIKVDKINRDQRISFSKDMLDKLIKKINCLGPDNLFSAEIYDEFKRRLSPSEWTYLQGQKIEFDSTQLKYVKSVNELAKIKGVAGCGKTSILGARALDAYGKHASVLILTFNITLKQLIRDKLSHINYHSTVKADNNKIEISNYHRFFMNQLNAVGAEIELPKNMTKEDEEQFWDALFKDGTAFASNNTVRYQSIFIDEIQDYEKEWIMIIREYFLEPNGEMVLFGDHAQNIYQRDEKPLNKAVIRGFGEWRQLTKSYRIGTDPLLLLGFKQFQEVFLQERHEDLDIFDHKAQEGILPVSSAGYKYYDDKGVTDLARTIEEYAKIHKLSPNDIAVISSKLSVLRDLEAIIATREKTIATFVTPKDISQLKEHSPKAKKILEGYGGNIERLQNKEEKTEDENQIASMLMKIERRKKTFFVQNSGLMKFSTVHSFKGMESKAVFCILHTTDEPEVVYTAITRARTNLVIFDTPNSKYGKFFRQVYGGA